MLITHRTYDHFSTEIYKNFRIINIDTSLLSLDDNDIGQLSVFFPELAKLEIEKDDKINIVIMHHGVEFLRPEDGRKFQHWLADNHVNMVFCGHNHAVGMQILTEAIAEEDGPQNGIPQFTCGAALSDSYARPSFYICEYTNAGELNVKLYEYPAFFRGHQRVGTPEYLSMMRLRKIWAEGSFSVLKREHCIARIRKRGILAATEECLLAAMALNLKRMVNAIFRYPQIYCSAGTSVGFSSFFAFVNRSLIVPYPHESPGRIRYDSVCKTAAKIVNIVKVEHTLPLRDGVCSTNAQIRDGSSYLVIRKSGTTVTPHLYSLE